MAVKLNFEELKITFDGDVTSPISFSCEDGDIVALILSRDFYDKALLNFLHFLPDEYEGNAVFHGKEFKLFTQEDKHNWQKTFASLTMHYPLINNLKVVENVYLPIFYRENAKEELLFEKAYNILTQLGIEKKYNQLPALLSNFEKKLAIFARVKMLEPAIIYYGNVFAELDEDKRQYLTGKILEFHAEREDRVSIVTARSENELKEIKFNKIIKV